MSKKNTVIYIVDDEVIVQQALNGILSHLEFEIKCFSNATDALSSLKKTSCDLIISDVNMPVMDGFEFLKEVKQKNPLLPVLLMSGYGDIPKAVKAIKSGAFDFIEKPLSEERLISAINLALLNTNLGHDKKLTLVELEILRLVAAGKNSKEISQTLDLSVRSIENYRHRIMKKLGISNAAGLVSYVIQPGW